MRPSASGCNSVGKSGRLISCWSLVQAQPPARKGKTMPIRSVTFYTVECSGCGAWHEELVNMMFDTVEEAMKAARQDGWQAKTGKKHLCPLCRYKKKDN